MAAKKYLSYLADKIHSAVAATIDQNSHPVTCAIDIMDYDDDSLYFLTARGKGFYSRLKNSNYLSLTGIKGAHTLSSVSVSVRGKTRELGPTLLPDLFRKNPYMEALYPTPESRSTLTVFQLYEGNGEWFDLSTLPIERVVFSFGNTNKIIDGYVVTDRCTGCGLCSSICPQKCIDVSTIPAIIHQKNCLLCGNCFEHCPVKAIQKRE